MKMMTTYALFVVAAGCVLDGGSTDLEVESAQDVQFENEGTTLAGTLWLPEGEGPHPAVVFVHGSGRVTRSGASWVATSLSRRGIAVLAYDKRGVGESGGTYVGRNNGSEHNLTLLARDAVAALAYVRAHESIDADQVGLWGVSQAGWIVPVAAVLDGHVAFTILMSGPTVTVGEENYYSELSGETTGGTSNLSQEEISRLLAERGPSGFDPRPYLEQMESPGLWLLGSADESIPIPETVAILDQLIETHGRPFSYRVWPDADHGLRVRGIPVQGFWGAQEEFLFEVAGVPRP